MLYSEPVEKLSHFYFTQEVSRDIIQPGSQQFSENEIYILIERGAASGIA